MLNIAKYLISTSANGPGKRACVWVQGCHRKCDGCCNVNYQPFVKKELIYAEDLAEKIIYDILTYNLRGITFSGGEPLYPFNHAPIIKFLKKVKEKIKDFDVFVFTGYSFQELNNSIFNNIMNYIDLLIAGPYIKEQINKKGIVASLNQFIIRKTDKFNDVTNFDLTYGERVIELHNYSDEAYITGLCSPEDFN